MDDFDPVARFGSARRPTPDAPARSAGADEAVVAALGELGKALEVVEEARGFLYAFHRRCGTADLTLQRAVGMLRDAGQAEVASQLEEVLVGRDVMAGRWSYQLIEDYDDGYWEVFRQMERWARAGLVDRHAHEQSMQVTEYTEGSL